MTLTPDHKVWTYHGWKEVQHLDLETDLVAVGVTMYIGGPLRLHLAIIFAATIVLAVLVSLFVLAPRRARVLK